MKTTFFGVVTLALLSVCMTGGLKAAQKDERIQAKPPVELRQNAASLEFHDSLTESPSGSDQEATTATTEETARIVWRPVS